jgi:selenocysteine lyase/cysteine desulfurase
MGVDLNADDSKQRFAARAALADPRPWSRCLRRVRARISAQIYDDMSDIDRLAEAVLRRPT